MSSTARPTKQAEENTLVVTFSEYYQMGMRSDLAGCDDKRGKSKHVLDASNDVCAPLQHFSYYVYGTLELYWNVVVLLIL